MLEFKRSREERKTLRRINKKFVKNSSEQNIHSTVFFLLFLHNHLLPDHLPPTLPCSGDRSSSTYLNTAKSAHPQFSQWRCFLCHEWPSSSPAWLSLPHLLNQSLKYVLGSLRSLLEKAPNILMLPHGYWLPLFPISPELIFVFCRIYIRICILFSKTGK